MTRFFTIVISAALLVAMISPVMTQKLICECKAPEVKGCSARASCSHHGCTAICGTHDACYAKCGKNLIKTNFTLKLERKSGQQISLALSRETGHQVNFLPKEKNDLFSIHITGDDMWNAMEYLNEHGKLTIDGAPWDSFQTMRGTVNNGKLFVTFNDISLKDALAHLSFLSGKTLRVKSRNNNKRFSLSLQDVTLGQVLDQISTQTHTRIQEPARP
jgi:hypothetical protein